MTKNILNIGIPSKGRLRKDVLNIFKKNKLKIFSEKGERDLISYVKNKNFNIKILMVFSPLKISFIFLKLVP